MTKVKGAVKGEWLQDALDALDIKVSELVQVIDAGNRRMIDTHIKQGNMGIGYLYAIKKAYPQVNLNYLVFGEKPILLTPNGADAENLDAMKRAKDILEQRLTE